jgi:hypothetical protein
MLEEKKHPGAHMSGQIFYSGHSRLFRTNESSAEFVMTLRRCQAVRFSRKRSSIMGFPSFGAGDMLRLAVQIFLILIISFLRAEAR